MIDRIMVVRGAEPALGVNIASLQPREAASMRDRPDTNAAADAEDKR
jgi:hypothetical protein